MNTYCQSAEFHTNQKEDHEKLSNGNDGNWISRIDIM